jgi:signal transduction histidine kinase
MDTYAQSTAQTAAPALPALNLTPQLIELLVTEAHQARADALAETLRSLTGPNGARPYGRAAGAIGVPEVIVRAGKVRPYLMADAMVTAVFDLAAFIGRLFRGDGTGAAGDAARETPRAAGGLRQQLAEPLASIRTLAEVLRDNPALAPEQRNHMLGLIVDQSDRFDRVVGASLRVAARG